MSDHGTNWTDVSAETRDTMKDLGNFGPTVNQADREVKGYTPDADGELRKTYWTSANLRAMAGHLHEVADWLDQRAQKDGGQ